MAGERTSRSRRSSGGNIPVRQAASVGLRDSNRATGGRRVDPGAIQDPIRNVQRLNQALSGFFNTAIATLEQLKDEDAKDQIAHEKALNVEQAQQAKLDAAKGIKNDNLFETDWDYRLAHKAATTGKEIAEIRREEAKTRAQGDADKYIQARAKLSGGDVSAIGTSGKGVQHDAAVFADGVANAAGQRMLDAGMAAFKGGSAEEIAAKKAEMAKKFADDYMEAHGLKDHPHAAAIHLHLRGSMRKVLSQAETAESNRRRTAERKEAAMAALEKVQGSLANGNIGAAEDILRANGDGEATARAKVVGALGIMIRRGEISPSKAIAMAKARVAQSSDPAVKAAYTGLLKTALETKRLGSTQQKVNFQKLVTAGGELALRATKQGFTPEVRSALKQYELDVRKAFRENRVTERSYTQLLNGIRALTAASVKGQAAANNLNQAFQTGQKTNGNTTQKEKSDLFGRLRQAHMDQQGEAAAGETAQQPDPGQASIAAAEEMIRKNLSPPSSFLAPLVAAAKATQHDGAAGLRALSILSRLDAVKPGVMSGDLSSIRPLMDLVKNHGFLNSAPEKAEKIAADIAERGARTDPIDYFWQGETGDEKKTEFVRNKVRAALRELNDDREVILSMNDKDLVKMAVREAHMQNIPLASGDEGFKMALKRLMDTKAIHVRHTYARGGDVTSSTLHKGSDPVATISPSRAIGPDKKEQVQNVLTFMYNGFAGSITVNGKKMEIGFDGGPLDLRNVGISFIPRKDGKGYMVATSGGQIVRIMAGGLVGRMQPTGAPSDGNRFEIKEHMRKEYDEYRRTFFRSAPFHNRPKNPAALDAAMKAYDDRYEKWQAGFRSSKNRAEYLSNNPEPFHPGKKNFYKGRDNVSGSTTLRMPEGLSISQAKDWLKRNVPLRHGLSFEVVERNGVAVAAEVRWTPSPASSTPELDKRLKE